MLFFKFNSINEYKNIKIVVATVNACEKHHVQSIDILHVRVLRPPPIQQQIETCDGNCVVRRSRSTLLPNRTIRRHAERYERAFFRFRFQEFFFSSAGSSFLLRDVPYYRVRNQLTGSGLNLHHVGRLLRDEYRMILLYYFILSVRADATFITACKVFL